TLEAAGLDDFSNALVKAEDAFVGMTVPDGGPPPPPMPPLLTLAFCVPPNDKLLGYWDVVADRLFKIRHCMNIEGVVRQLPLFEPPLDPGMLVKAAAAGLDIGSIVNSLNQPIGPVRSLMLIQKAVELCSEIKSLGTGLLAA